MSYAAEIFGRNGKHAVTDESANNHKGKALFRCFSFADAHNATRLLSSLEDDGEVMDELLSSWEGEDVDNCTLRDEMTRHGVTYK